MNDTQRAIRLAFVIEPNTHPPSTAGLDADIEVVAHPDEAFDRDRTDIVVICGHTDWVLNQIHQRRTGQQPLIAVVSDDSAASRAHALDTGAIHALSQPLDTALLVAHITALNRRCSTNTSPR